ncbi:MAG: ABC transporter permease [Bacilli bacterium]
MQISDKRKKILLIHHMVIHKIKLDYSDQLFGYAWALINPLVYIFSYWFFSYVGFRGGGNVQGIPYIVWFIPGVLCYRFLASVTSQAPAMLTKNSVLIKESNFDIRAIPLIETLKESYVHVGVMLLMSVFFTIVGYTMTHSWDYRPSIYYFNLLYYWFTAFVYCSLLGYILSAIGLIFRDSKNIVKSALIPMFWMTPVLFPVENGINPVLERIEMLVNPFYYFINGYRNTYLYHKFFFEDVWYNLYIWLVIIIMFFIARKVWTFILPIAADLV